MQNETSKYPICLKQLNPIHFHKDGSNFAVNMAAMFKRDAIYRGWHSPIVTLPTWNAAYRLASSNKLMFSFYMQTSEIKPIVTRQELLNTFELMPTVSTGTWATSPERTAKRALNTRRVNGYIIISISCSNTLVFARGRGINLCGRDWLSTPFCFAFTRDNEDRVVKLLVVDILLLLLLLRWCDSSWK